MISIGVEHDKGLFVWNWARGIRETSNKVSKRITSIAFSPDGKYFATAGQNSIKCWYFDKSDRPVTTQSSVHSEVKCMDSRPIDLAEMGNKTFVSVTISNNFIFSLTSCGLL